MLFWMVHDDVLANAEGKGGDQEPPRSSVSIVIPVLNEEACIRTVLLYTKMMKPAPLEVIVVDGGSTDGTTKIGVQVASHAARAHAPIDDIRDRVPLTLRTNAQKWPPRSRSRNRRRSCQATCSFHRSAARSSSRRGRTSPSARCVKPPPRSTHFLDTFFPHQHSRADVIMMLD